MYFGTLQIKERTKARLVVAWLVMTTMNDSYRLLACIRAAFRVTVNA